MNYICWDLGERTIVSFTQWALTATFPSSEDVEAFKTVIQQAPEMMISLEQQPMKFHFTFIIICDFSCHISH